jgi:two-component system phosphate regulon sensor histidine kinase PhoR
VLFDAAGRVRYWNGAAEALFGFSESDVLGKVLVDVFPAWQDVASHVPLSLASEPGAARPATVPVRVADEERWLSAVGVDFGDGRVYAIRDVTDEQRLERARSEFVATASHELRTPLAAIFGAVRTLRRSDVEFGPEQIETFLAMIDRESQRLIAIVEQILAAGELDAGEVRLTTVTCDVASLAEDVVEAARHRAPDHLSLVVRVPDGTPRAMCDEGKLRQVLVNLVDNAIKYSPDGGEVAVEVGETNGRARILVRDEGIGIPRSEQERIFEKFYRLDPSLARGVGGSGLGLYISRELITRMGGRLSVDSTVGRGSVFTVELPST